MRVHICMNMNIIEVKTLAFYSYHFSQIFNCMFE